LIIESSCVQKKWKIYLDRKKKQRRENRRICLSLKVTFISFSLFNKIKKKQCAALAIERKNQLSYWKMTLNGDWHTRQFFLHETHTHTHFWFCSMSSIKTSAHIANVVSMSNVVLCRGENEKLFLSLSLSLFNAYHELCSKTTCIKVPKHICSP
jgi:hypothetical protein